MACLTPDEPDWRFFERYIRRWHIHPDGEPVVTPASRLLPVSLSGAPAMLKVATMPEERFGARLMVWWAGEGAAKVFAHEGDALLMERATGENSLGEMARAGMDDEATRIVCVVAERLHRHRLDPLPVLVTLDRWFEALWSAGSKYGGLFAVAAAIARRLIAEDREPVVLHGDLHHGNVLDFGERGWLVIDPKGLFGERTFDYVNLLRNPDPGLALTPGRFERQVEVIAGAANLDRTRFLEWTLAFTCLSAAWILHDRDEPELDLSIAGKAAAVLGVAPSS